VTGPLSQLPDLCAAGPKLSMPRARASAACLQSAVYVVGGSFHTSTCTATVECLREADQQWQQVPAMATARAYPAVAAAGEHLLVAGGHDPEGGEYFASVEVYNGTTQVWSSLPELPFPRSASAAVFHNGEFWVLGGQRAGKRIDDTEVFDWKKQEWSSGGGPKLLQSRSHAMCVTFSGYDKQS